MGSEKRGLTYRDAGVDIDAADKAVLKPVARAYNTVTPEPLRAMVRNFFNNLGDPWIGTNNLLQGKPLEAITDWMRFAINTTIGFFGIIDVASQARLEKHDEQEHPDCRGRVRKCPTGSFLCRPAFERRKRL